MNPAKSTAEGQSPLSKPELNYYKILDVRETADRMEIRESYVRLKKTFSGQNQALYSLVSPEESNRALAQVEEAFRVLDDEYQRETYDRALFGPRSAHDAASADYPARKEHGAFAAGEPLHTAALPSSDAVDPFRGAAVDAFGGQPARTDRHKPQSGAIGETLRDTMHHGGGRGAGLGAGLGVGRIGSDWASDAAGHAYEPKQYPPIEKVAKRAQSEELRSQVRELVERSDVGSGLLYREIRELLEVSRAEIQNKTKVSPEYVIAIEENAFHILPAAVYVKGFVKSYLEYLGVENVESIASAFVERFKKWQEAEKP